MAALCRGARFTKYIISSIHNTRCLSAHNVIVRKNHSGRIHRIPNIVNNVGFKAHRQTPQRRGFCEQITTADTSKVLQESERPYPAGEFWKKIDTASGSKIDDFHTLNATFAEKMRSMSNFGRKDFYIFMKLADEAETMSSLEAVTVIMSTSSFENISIPRSECAKWAVYVHEKMKAKGIQLDVRYYNHLLNSFNSNLVDFAPVDILEEMKSKDIEPNRMTFQKIVVKYCRSGDMQAVSMVLEHMKDLGYPLTLFLYNTIIKGHILAKDYKTAERLYYETEEQGFQMDQQSYFNIIWLRALQDNMEEVEQMLSEAKSRVNISDGFLSSMIEKMADAGSEKMLEFFLNELSQMSKVFYNEARDRVTTMLENGHYEVALRYFMHLSNPNGLLFLRPALITNMPIDKILEAQKLISEKTDNKSSLKTFLSLCVTEMEFDKGFHVLKVIDAKGEMQPNYLWPFLCHYANSKDEDGLKEALKLLSSIPTSAETVSLYVKQCCKKVGWTLYYVSDLLKEQGLSSDWINTFKFIFLWEDSPDKALKTVAGRNLDSELANNYMHWFQSYQRGDILKLLFALAPNLDFETLKITAERLYRMSRSEDYRNRLVAGLSSVPGLKLRAKEFTLNGAPLLNLQLELEYVDFKLLSYGNLKKLYKQRPTGSLRKAVLFRCLSERKFEDLLGIVTDEDLVNASDQLLHRLVYGLSCVHGKEHASKIIKGLTLLKERNIVVNAMLIFKAAKNLKESGHYEDSLSILYDFKKQFNTSNEENLKYISMFERNSEQTTEEEVDWAHKMVNAMKEADLIPRNRQMIIYSSYINFVSGSEKVQDLCSCIDNLSSMTILFPLYPLLTPFIRNNDKDSLQKMVNHVMGCFDEQIALTNLTLAFIMEGQKELAKKVLQTPGFRMAETYLQIHMLGVKDKFALLNDLYSLVTDWHVVRKQELLFNMLVVICNSRYHTREECIEFFNTKYDEEDIIPSAKAQNYFENFLKKNKEVYDEVVITEDAMD